MCSSAPHTRMLQIQTVVIETMGNELYCHYSEGISTSAGCSVTQLPSACTQQAEAALTCCACLPWCQMWWWEEAGLGQAAVLRAAPLLRWRAWAAHCGVLRARRSRAFVQVCTRNDACSAAA